MAERSNSWHARAADRRDLRIVEESDNFSPTEKLALTLEWLSRELLSARNRYPSALSEPHVDARLSDLTAELAEMAWRLAPDVVQPEDAGAVQL